MPRVVHFELPADDPYRAARFYSSVFGWKIEKWAGPMDYWMIATGGAEEPGIDGAIMRREDPIRDLNVIVDVPSVDEFAAKVLASGGKIIAPKTPVPGVGYLAYCQDTEGTIFGIMQSDETAK